MNDELLKDEVIKIADNIIEKSYQKDKKNEIIKIIMRALTNEESILESKKLLEVIKRTTWFNESEITNFFDSFITNIYNEYGNQFYVVYKKEKDSSSNSNIVTDMLTKGQIETTNTIMYSEKNKMIFYKDIPDDAIILVIDDYIGSGNSVKKIMKCLESTYMNKKVIICSYIWQEKGLAEIYKFLEKSPPKNCYEIYDKNIKIQKDFKEICSDSEDVLDYIENVCDGAEDKNLKYGYGKVGAMLVINGIAPNDNISMLWYDKILHNGEKWFPVFNVELSNLLIANRKESILKKSKPELEMFYQSFIYKDKYSISEFIMLFLLFNIYCINVIKIKNLLGLDTIEEVNNIIEKFKNDNIIVYDTDNILEFIDYNIIKQFKKFENELYYNQKDKLLKKVSLYI